MISLRLIQAIRRRGLACGLGLSVALPMVAPAATVLLSAAEPGYPPLSLASADNRAEGFAVELLREAAGKAGFEISFEIGAWADIKNALAEGRISVLPLVGRTPEREALFDFTFPYLTLRGALFVREGETRIAGLADLAGQTIAVMRGDNAEEYVRRAALSDRIVTTKTFEDAFRLLAAGDADAVIAQRLMGVTLLQRLNLPGIKTVGGPNEAFKQESFPVFLS